MPFITLRLNAIAAIAYALLIIPIAFFLLGWTYLYFGIPSVVLLAYGAVWILRRDFFAGERRSIEVPLMHVAVICVLLALWVAFSGICGPGVAGWDIPWRNATLRDLIDWPWPVVYPDGKAFVYYCAFWLPSAAVGKLAGWTAAEVALWLHVTLIVICCWLLILFLLKAVTPKRIWAAALMLVLFSGLGVAGLVVSDIVTGSAHPHELLSTGTHYVVGMGSGVYDNFYGWRFRNDLEVLKWVYNQIPYWLVVPLMLLRREPHSYIFLGLLLFPYTPWAFVGLIPVMIAAAAPSMARIVREQGAARLAKDILSPANVTGMLGILPVFSLYFLASGRLDSGVPTAAGQGAVAGQAAGASGGLVGITDMGGMTPVIAASTVMFLILEFGIYMLLIHDAHRRDPLFFTMLAWLVICPFIWIGTGKSHDFGMNVSLPSLFVLMLMLLGYLEERVFGKPLGMRGLAVVLACALGAMSPILWMSMDARDLLGAHAVGVIDEHVWTFSNADIETCRNFCIEDPSQVAFYRFVAR